LTKRTLFFLAGTVFLAYLFASCGHSVSRVDSTTQMDLSGYWNDTDLRLASDALVDSALNSARISGFRSDYGRLPVIIVGHFRNASDEHIDTTLLSQRMEFSILNSGRASFVASGELRDALREERLDQHRGYTDDATVAALGRERGADFMMTGSVRTIIDRDPRGRTATRSYFISAELTSITTNERLWIGQYDEIKKVIRNPGARL